MRSKALDLEPPSCYRAPQRDDADCSGAPNGQQFFCVFVVFSWFLCFSPGSSNFFFDFLFLGCYLLLRQLLLPLLLLIVCCLHSEKFAWKIRRKSIETEKTRGKKLGSFIQKLEQRSNS